MCQLCCHSEPGGALPGLASSWGGVAGAGGQEEVDTLGDLTVYRCGGHRLGAHAQ